MGTVSYLEGMFYYSDFKAAVFLCVSLVVFAELPCQVLN